MNRTDWLSSRPLTWRIAGLICALLLLIQLIFLALVRAASAFSFIGVESLEKYWVSAQGLVFHVAGIAVVTAVLKRARLSWRSVFGIRGRGLAADAGLGAAYYFAVFPVFVLVSIAYRTALLFFGVPVSMQEVVSVFLTPMTSTALVMHIILAVLAAPVAEEILFRGILLPLLSQIQGTPAAVITTSFLFAFVHFHVPSFLPLFVLALALSAAYIRSRSIIVPIIMHILFNAVNIGLLFLIGSSLKP